MRLALQEASASRALPEPRDLAAQRGQLELALPVRLDLQEASASQERPVRASPAPQDLADPSEQLARE